MLRWLRCIRGRFVRGWFVRGWFVLGSFIRGRFVRPVDLLVAALCPNPKAPESERRTGEDDQRCPDVEAKPQDVVGWVGAQHLDEPSADRVEHPVEREDLAPGETEPAVAQHP